MHIWNVPNLLSFLRLPMAILFLVPNIPFRLLIVSTAAATDFLDGYIARRYNLTTRFGTVLDPITDKTFVLVALTLFYMENRISMLEIGAMLCRDFAVCLFGSYLILSGQFTRYQFRSIWCGKITTTLQFLVLFILTLQTAIPFPFYGLFILLGVAALGELYMTNKTIIPPEMRKQP